MFLQRLILLFSLVALVTNCTTTSQISLDYTSGIGHIQPGAPDYVTQTFVDHRDLGAMDLGTVRTQIGTPVEHVQTRVPVADVVTNAFGHGLQARGMLAARSGARYVVTGEILDFHCKLLVHPYGYARLRVAILEAGTGRILHSAVYEGERQSKAYVPGRGSPVPVLRDLASGALQDAVDRALDDPAMRGQIRGGSGGGGGFSAPSPEQTGWVPGSI